jgi:hypothetical protein
MLVNKELSDVPHTGHIDASSLSDEFKAMAKLNCFATINDVLNYGVDGVPELPQGNYQLLVELLEWLEENGLLDAADRIEEIDY